MPPKNRFIEKLDIGPKNRFIKNITKKNVFLKYEVGSFIVRLLRFHFMNLKKTVYLHNEEETLAIGKSFSKTLKPGMVIYLYGDLGSGKTCFARAVLNALGYTGPVKSPSYAIAEEYTVTIQNENIKLVHFDFYRMDHPEEFTDAGLDENFNDKTLCLIEWPEKAKDLIPPADVELTFIITGPGRKLYLAGKSENGNHTVGSTCLALEKP